MVTIKDQKLKKGISEAIKKAQFFNKPTLYSEVQQIDYINPLAFFHAGQKDYKGNRTFWRNAEGDFYLVGLGICYQLQTNYSNNRFLHVEKEWKELIDNAVVRSSIRKSGIGPTMLGGFSFDEKKKKTVLWDKFGDNVLILPTFMLTVNNRHTYLTINVMCTQHDDYKLLAAKIENQINNVLADISLIDLQQAHLIEKKEINPIGWKQNVYDVVQMLKNKEADKVVLAREMQLVFEKKVNIESVVNQLLEQQKTSYVFALESAGDCFLGATPERLAELKDNVLKTACVAGSIPRGKDEEEDRRLGQELINDNKNILEHNYVVQMIKSSMEQVCTTVKLPHKMSLLKTKHIQHLYTPIEGIIKEGNTFLPVIDLLHPTPALGGLPKEKAKEIIREIEELDRGLYGAPIGWMDYQGNGEYAVAIRSGLIQNRKVSIFAGCGVVEDSNPESEYLETQVKFNPMLSALGGTVS